MKREAVAALIAILVVASLGIGYVTGNNAGSTKTALRHRPPSAHPP
jgi:hypothetical protein